MGKFRKVDPRIWNDEKFRSLSHHGQLAFFLLLTHPHMTSLGAMRATVEGLASESGLPAEAFREAFSKELARYDEEACCVTLPNFIRYNRPESPNVVRGAWREAADLIPECELKAAQIQRAEAMLEGFDQGFLKAFREAFGKPSRKTSPNPEQEPEQEQEEIVAPPSAPPPGAGTAGHRGNGAGPSFETFWKTYPGRAGRKRDRAEAEKQWNRLSVEDRIAALEDVADRLQRDEQWRRGFPKDAHRYLKNRGWENDELAETELPYTPA